MEIRRSTGWRETFSTDVAVSVHAIISAREWQRWLLFLLAVAALSRALLIG